MDGMIQGLRAFVFFTLLTGFGYPLLVLVAGRLAFSEQVNGSLIQKDGKVLGSELIGQNFDQPQYFWGRPSATGPKPYNAEASSGSNYGPLNPDLKKGLGERTALLRKENPTAGDMVPIDLVTASGSGLDPHISPDAARYQAARVAKARNLTEPQVSELVQRFIEERQFGVLGEPRVNVLRLNLALDGVL